jgi:hypothetical protein
MKKADYFDWSCLDRYTIVLLINSAKDSFIGKTLTTVEFSKKIKETLQYYDIPVRVISSYNKKTTPNTAWVGGFYDSVKDALSIGSSIAIKLQYNSPKSTITIKHNHFKRLCQSIADTLMHEIIHMRQYRRRNFKNIPGYASVAESKRKQMDQEYFGHRDEIDAYSFNIACQLYDRFGNDYQIIKYLDSNLSDNRKKQDAFKMYLDTFDHDHRHPVIIQLKKRIVRYLPNVIEGKPYKTSEWLKSEKNKNKN